MSSRFLSDDQMTLLLILFPTLLFTVSCGVENMDDGEEKVVYEGVSPDAVYILSISEDRPAEMRIGWMENVIDCEDATGRAAQRDGNTIEITIDVSDWKGAICHELSREVYGEFTVKNLEVGEYIIKSGDREYREFGRLRIEPETAYSFVDFGIPLIKAVPLDDEEHIGDTYHITVSAVFSGLSNREPIIKTTIARVRDVINIEAWQVVPKTGGLAVDYRYYLNQIDIDLGTFSAGSYTLIINDYEHPFEVPPMSD